MIKAYSYVLLWMSVSCAVILFNKWVLAFSGFPFPITLTLWHMVFCSTVGFICVRVLKLVKSHNMSAREYCNRVLPIGERQQHFDLARLHGAFVDLSNHCVQASSTPAASGFQTRPTCICRCPSSR